MYNILYPQQDSECNVKEMATDRLLAEIHARRKSMRKSKRLEMDLDNHFIYEFTSPIVEHGIQKEHILRSPFESSANQCTLEKQSWNPHSTNLISGTDTVVLVRPGSVEEPETQGRSKWSNCLRLTMHTQRRGHQPKSIGVNAQAAKKIQRYITELRCSRCGCKPGARVCTHELQFA